MSAGERVGICGRTGSGKSTLPLGSDMAVGQCNRTGKWSETVVKALGLVSGSADVWNTWSCGGQDQLSMDVVP